MKPVDIRSIIHPPQSVGEISTENLAMRRAAYNEGGLARGLPMYSATLDITDPDKDGLLPVLRGEMMTIIGRPGHAKTSTMIRLSRARSQDISTRAALGDKDAARRKVLYISYEQTIEDLNAFHVAASLSQEKALSITSMAMGKIDDAQWEEIEFINQRRAADPLWFIGHSIQRPSMIRRLGTDELARVFETVQDWQGGDSFIIDSIFIDYLQAMPYHGEKAQGVSDNLDELKLLAKSVARASIVVGVQAKREVDERDDPTPQMNDGQWTSNIEQASDKVISQIFPAKYFAQKETFGDIIINGKQQMKITVLKQKMGPAPFARWVYFDTRYNILNDLETRRVDLN